MTKKDRPIELPLLLLLVACSGTTSGETVAVPGPDAGSSSPSIADDAGIAETSSHACSVLPSTLNVVLGRPTATGISVSILASPGAQAFVEYGTACETYTARSPSSTSVAGEPIVVEVTGLAPDTLYFYRVHYASSDGSGDTVDAEQSFRTARALGKAFSFAVRGDSHPERAGTMFSAELYALQMENVRLRQPDFYLWLGDDFSIDPLFDSNTLDQPAVDAVYARQRGFAGLVGPSVPIFLVNGNHEEAAAYLLSAAYQTPYASGPIWAGAARARLFPQPSEGGFYTGDTKAIDGVGPLRDYYAWQWGDALFVTLDPYWHSPVPVDNPAPGVTSKKGSWDATIGDEQYGWLRNTLEQSTAKYKFVFAHHVNGTGRGGAAIAHAYEWGGYDQKGRNYEFSAKRPHWPKPIHQLMRDTHVTIFFFGHDHVFAREKVDGIVYQSVQNPADNSYTAFNADAFGPSSIAFPGADYDPGYAVVLSNSGHLHVAVAADKVTVDYVRAVLPADESKVGFSNGEVAYSYEVVAR